jgi:hypothetical protein
MLVLALIGCGAKADFCSRIQLVLDERREGSPPKSRRS